MHHSGGAILGIVPLAAVAVAGWWVLRVNEKDGSGAVAWGGRIVGWTLVVVGLLGTLCAVAGHIKNQIVSAECCRGEGRDMMAGGDRRGWEGGTMMPPGHPPADGADKDSPAPKKN